ncbi:MAG: hypothetical protein FRX49_13828 [Trebouxia sp. A1-2]|nr:MAG: hypothetical protein FRX49_13828 [Trebouxia sp. A1-2]
MPESRLQVSFFEQLEGWTGYRFQSWTAGKTDLLEIRISGQVAISESPLQRVQGVLYGHVLCLALQGLLAERICSNYGCIWIYFTCNPSNDKSSLSQQRMRSPHPCEMGRGSERGPHQPGLSKQDHFAAAAVAAAAAADVAGAQKLEWMAGVEMDRMRWRGDERRQALHNVQPSNKGGTDKLFGVTHPCLQGFCDRT